MCNYLTRKYKEGVCNMQERTTFFKHMLVAAFFSFFLFLPQVRPFYCKRQKVVWTTYNKNDFPEIVIERKEQGTVIAKQQQQ